MGYVYDALAESHLDTNEAARVAADIAVDCTLNMISQFASELAFELMSKRLHSEAMTAGIIRRQLKELMDGRP